MATTYLNKALALIQSQLRFLRGITVETLAGTYTFSAKSPNIGYFDADSSNRNMQLLAEEMSEGWFGIYVNAGSAGNLVFLNDAAGTVATVTPGGAVILCCDGATWGAKVLSGVGTASGTTAPAFTGTAPTSAVDLATPVFSGTGQSSAGQVITTTDNQTMAANQCAGMFFVSATHGPYLIASNTAVTGAPAVLTIYGTAPTTDAGTYKILRGPTPAGSVASHTHTNG